MNLESSSGHSGVERELDARARQIDLAHQPDIQLASLEVRPSLRKLIGPDGEAMVEPKVMQVLVALASPVGAILSRDDLIERCWQGRVVGDTSINRVISLLRNALRETVGDGVSVETVPKVGYRILVHEQEDHPQQPEPNEVAPPAAVPKPAEPELRTLPGSGVLVAAIAAVLAIVAGAWTWFQPASAGPADEIKIVMLPLDLAEGVDPLYATGLETELRREFAGVGAVVVTSGQNARNLLAKGYEPTAIGRKLKADYVWSGELDVEVERVALGASLISLENNREVWSDQVASAPDSAQFLPLRTARSMADALGRTAADRSATGDVTSQDYSLYLTAIGLIKSRGDDQRVAAVNILEQVTERSPDFANGWGGLAKAYYLTPEGENSTNRALAKEYAELALELDPNSVDALKVAGMVADDPETMLGFLSKAVELDPGDAEAWFWLGINQRQYPMVAQAIGAGSFRDSTLRMVELDPLWPASWRAADHAAEHGDLDQARQIEGEILAAAVTQTEARLAEARLARIDGDLSRYMELSRQALENSTPAQRRFSIYYDLHLVQGMLGIEPVDYGYDEAMGAKYLLRRFHRREPVTLAEIEEAGAGGDQFWDDGALLKGALPHLTATGQSDGVLALYDARFENPAAFITHLGTLGGPKWVVPQHAPIVAMILQDAGRNEEAAQLLEAAEEQIARWDAFGTNWVGSILLEINVAAAKGEVERAAALIARLPEFGWPYNQAQLGDGSVILLTGHPLFANVVDHPQAQAVLAPIRADLAREREEWLAAGG